MFELNYYLTPVSVSNEICLFSEQIQMFTCLSQYVHEELMIDISASGKKLTINFDITFPHVGCSRK